METPENKNELKISREIFRQSPGTVIAIALLAVLSTAGTLALPLTAAALIAAMQNGEGVVPFTLLMVGVGLGGALASALSTYLLSRVGEQLVGTVRTRFMRHTLRLPLHRVQKEGNGDLAARLGSDGLQLKSIVDVGVMQLPMAVVTLIGTIAIMAWLDWVLLMVTLLSFTLSACGVVLVVSALRRSFLHLQDNVGHLSQSFLYALEALSTIKAYRHESATSKRLGELADRTTEAGIHTSKLGSLLFPVINLGQQVALLTVIVGGGIRLAGGQIDLPVLAAFLLYLLQLAAPLLLSAMGLGSLQAGMAARKRFNNILTLPTEADEDPQEGAVLPRRKGDFALTFDGVEFSYGENKVLKGVDLSVPAHGTTAIVGLSGAGKTTVLALIERFIRPESGHVEVLGRDVSQWPVHELRGRIAYVDQSCVLLRDTVRANLAVGSNTPVSDERLCEVLIEVGLDEWVHSLPDALDTELTNGVDASGGQRQRLALGRAILADSEIVLLDEPTSHLDSVNEARLRDTIARLAQDRAMVVVAHRMSTVQEADQIIVMDAGRVVAQGTHGDLVRESPEYSDLVSGQLLSDTV